MDREWRVKGMEKRKGEVKEGRKERRERKENEVEINRKEWIKKECLERSGGEEKNVEETDGREPTEWERKLKG